MLEILCFYWEKGYGAAQVASEIFLVGFCAYSSILVGWGFGFIPAAPSSTNQCVSSRVPCDGGGVLSLPREEVGRRKGSTLKSV
jgi:hypothetical protein